MANQLEPHAEWQRLHERYHTMSDGELLNLAENIDDLTEIATEVLRREMRERKLEFEKPLAVSEDSQVPAGQPALGNTEDGKVVVTVLRDTVEAKCVCEFFEDNRIPFELRDQSQMGTGLGFFDGGQPIAMQLVVSTGDRERALAALHEAMTPFRQRQAEGTEELVDDGSVSTLGDFARREDAEKFGHILDDARMWHRIVPNPDGTEEDENLFALEVREIDLIRAGELVEKAMNLPEA